MGNPGSQERKVIKDRQVLLERRVMQDRLVFKVQLEMLDQRVPVVLMDRVELRALLAQQVPQVPLDHKEIKVDQEPWDHKVSLVQLV